ncbi:p21-activated protein kinase-interacting protein 1-like [Nasonia vitripennis]|uniref:P21-activated protein kinase-interacting protein 1-like n=1 Tax=Nasonia vitripennis TaxID=7425 RepID=A0A7M7G8A8_NASVI|nr:p21-activated protein kinase-interacting protein 1-like [Nasonia vitripennis]
MAPNLEVVVGTYEQFLLGYTVDDVVNKYKMEQSFATHSHLASIRSVASNKHYLASSAADDTVCLYDMRTRMENGKLVHHNDTVNSVAFTPDASHIITASSDGTIGIVRCGNWQVEKHWLKPHKGLAVDTLAVHPTGKIAMTTGHDGVLRTWNLVKGRQAYATNLVPRWKLDAKNISVLKWSPTGNSYLLAANNRIDVYSVETAGIKEEFNFDAKVVCVEYLNDEYIAIGLADGKIIIHNCETGDLTKEIQAHEARVKCLASEGDMLVSASSSGEIKLWSVKSNELKLLSSTNCSARISCLTLNSCEYLKKKQDEITVLDKVPEKPSNKLRLKQCVIIEEEGGDENKTTRMSKKKRDKKKARKLLEEAEQANAEDENVKTVQTKKMKTDLPKKQKRDTSDLPSENPKKKKKLDSPNKRKSTDSVDDDITEVPAKKKKQKGIAAEKAIADKSNQINANKKKRKIPLEDTENSPKKPKAVVVKVHKGEHALVKKKKKKNFKNKISR